MKFSSLQSRTFTELQSIGAPADAAHMLGVMGTMPELAGLGPRVPMLRAEQVLFFANGNVESFERQIIENLG